MPAQRPSLSFFGLVAAIMTALKIKDYLEARQTGNVEEGRIALPPDEQSEDAVSMLNTQLPTQRSARPKRAKSCCVCCGMNCGLFWKAVGLAAVVFILWGLIKSIFWALKPTPTGLEDMPAFNTSLGCLNNRYAYNDSRPMRIKVPFGEKFDHGLAIRGAIVGTVTIAEATADADTKEVEYDILITSQERSPFDQLSIKYPPEHDEDGSRLTIDTPRVGIASACMRFDVTLYVPPALKTLRLDLQSLSHVQFSPSASLENLEELDISLASYKSGDMILPRESIRPHKLKLEVKEGWIVGDVSIGEAAAITTADGAGVINVKAHPIPESTEVAVFNTYSGTGRTDVVYTGNGRRQIKNLHNSLQNGDLYLTYRASAFSGKIQLGAPSYSARGIQRLAGSLEKEKWTHWFDDKEGKDELVVSTRGWAGVYF